LGIVYGDIFETHWDDLTFPLLDGFCEEFKDAKRGKPDRIIVLLTDQEAIFESGDRDWDRPYWQDTCALEPILKCYFGKAFGEQFVKNRVKFSTLKPTKREDGQEIGLDDWDATLKLVQHEFGDWGISKGDRVIVSHQAGTPAISSAVQLTSLIRFGKKVEFLVSSELNPDRTKFLKGSSYFETLQSKKLEDLLARNDYAGMAIILESLKLEDSDYKTRLEHLLDLAKLWNAAKFDQFASKMGGAAVSRSSQWWWKGYEMAYLAVIRMKQGDPTEALFHSVRAIEGLICEWAIHKERRSELYGQFLYDLFKLRRTDCNNHPIQIVWVRLAHVRNKLFHTLRGISAEEVWDAWDESSRESWEKRMFVCLNFVTKGDRQDEFLSLKSASLMLQVHQELEKTIKLLSSSQS